MISQLLLRNAMIVSTWTEDRAMLGSTPSAVPGAETEGPGHRPGVPADSRALRDQHQCDKPIGQPPKRLRIVQPAPSRSRRTSTGEVPQDGGGTLSTAAFDGTALYVGGGIPPGSTDPYVHGSVVAIDPASGEILGRQGFPGPVIAPVSTVRRVIFAAGGNLIAAPDARDGKVLWSYRTAALLYGGIAIAGDTIFVGDLSGKLYAFRIS